MAWFGNLNLHLLGAGDRRIEVVEFKPEEHAVSIGLCTWITDRTVVMLDVPSGE